MKEHITSDMVANEVRLERDQHDGAFLLVEGPSDWRLFRRFVDGRRCHLVVAYGKDNLIGAIQTLDSDGFEGALDVMDADFWYLECRGPLSRNITITDTHDIETMMLASPALEKLLAELCSEQKARATTERSGKCVRLMLLRAGVPLGYLRWVSDLRGLGLVFDDLRYHHFIDGETLAVEVSAMIRAVKNKSVRHDLAEADLRKAIEEAQDPAHNPWHVCCGHDLICILSFGLCRCLGSRRSSDVAPEILERELRMAYEFCFFAQTRLYAAMRDWEAHNPPYSIFSCVREAENSVEPATLATGEEDAAA